MKLNWTLLQKFYINDIRFWILFFFIVRLYGITFPPLEVAHNWRQTTVTMVARNFLEQDNNILYPRIDIAGEKPGITGMEFPFLNYLIYLMSLAFGYAHWYGRFINLLVSSIGILFFYKILLFFFDKRFSFIASFILLISVWFTYSRKIMPDTFSMSLVFIGAYYGLLFFKDKASIKNLTIYFAFILLGVLSKLPSAYCLVLFAYALVYFQIPISKKIMFGVSNLILISIISSYYFLWVPYLTNKFQFYHFYMGVDLMQGFSEIKNHLGDTFEKFYEEGILYFGFVLFLIGTVLIFRSKNKHLKIAISMLFIAFLVLIFKAGNTFSQHSYYMIPFAPVMCVVAAYTINSRQSKKIIISCLVLLFVEAMANKAHDFFIYEKDLRILNLETDMLVCNPQKALVLINSGNVPTPMYFAHQKGWVSFNENILKNNYVDSLKTKGLGYIIILKQKFGTEIKLNYNQIVTNPSYSIYKL